MIENLVGVVTSIIITIINKTGYAGVFALMTAESALIPIPSEVTMPFAGYLAHLGRFNLYLVVLTGATANLIGSILAYWLGHWGQEAVIRKFIKTYGKFILLSEDEFNRAERWFRKYGEGITFTSRILPIIRTFISLPAGIASMNFWRFSLFTFTGSLIWSGILAFIGYTLGKNWNTLHVYYQRFEYLIIGIIVISALYYIVHKVMKLRRKI